MIAISLKLPDALARSATQTAARLGLSRAELIRQALIHELVEIQAKLELESMVKGFEAMAHDPAYQDDSALLDNALDPSLPEEPAEWWKG